MKRCGEYITDIRNGRYDRTLTYLYQNDMPGQRERYCATLSLFEEKFGDAAVVLVSAPGRTEVGGNHTDHQHGNVLAAAVNLDTFCVAAPNGEDVIRIQSVGYPMDTVALGDLERQPGEAGKAASLIRGVAAWFAARGVKVGGFNAYTTSAVLSGSGLSSSAAFEVAVGAIISRLFAPGTTAEQIAIAGQYAENQYFGKPSGLMDQMASSVGGFVQIDFSNPGQPVIRPVRRTLEEFGYHLCIVNTRGSHAGLTPDYAAIPAEMGKVAAYFGKSYLREVEEAEFYAALPKVREAAGDRAVLRAIHFFRDNKLAVASAQALEAGEMARFLQNVNTSGRSSLACLQNVFSGSHPERQGLTLALDLSERLLAGKGAWRVHGGGFAGTIQAFVPDELLEPFTRAQDALFGEGACNVLTIRPVGGVEVTPDLKEATTHGRA